MVRDIDVYEPPGCNCVCEPVDHHHGVKDVLQDLGHDDDVVWARHGEVHEIATMQTCYAPLARLFNWSGVDVNAFVRDTSSSQWF